MIGISTTNMLELSTWKIVLNVRVSKAFFIHLRMYYFILDILQLALMKLYDIKVLLNCAICRNFQIDEKS